MRFVRLSKLLHPVSIFGGFLQRPANVIAVETDVFQFPIAELTEGKKVRLALVACDRGGDPAVDEAADAGEQDDEPSPDDCPVRRAAWDGIKHGHRNVLRKLGIPFALKICPFREQ
jgi:hypothetical protein